MVIYSNSGLERCSENFLERHPATVFLDWLSRCILFRVPDRLQGKLLVSCWLVSMSIGYPVGDVHFFIFSSFQHLNRSMPKTIVCRTLGQGTGYLRRAMLHVWLVAWNMFLFFHIFRIIMPTDELHHLSEV